jgi:hypothetical protein
VIAPEKGARREEKNFLKKFGEERRVHYLCRPLPQKNREGVL